VCGRYTLSARKLALAEKALHCTFPELAPRYNIAPSQDVPIIRETSEGQYELVMVRWGLIPRWSKEPKTEYSTINARAETVAEKPAFRDAFRRRRCLIPADGFYEWKKEGTAKQPFHIRMKDGGGLRVRWPVGALAERRPGDRVVLDHRDRGERRLAPDPRPHAGDS
jgi:putative SOS response-associated peptidase YedK